jgi:hypothetical protein
MDAVLLNIQASQGYAADQVADDSITLQDLLEAVEQAIADHGESAKVVLKEGGRYGALFGNISQWSDVFSPVEDTDEEDY